MLVDGFLLRKYKIMPIGFTALYASALCVKATSLAILA